MAQELDITPTIRGQRMSYRLAGTGRAVRDSSLSDTDTFTYAGICARLADNAAEQTRLRRGIRKALDAAADMASFAKNLKATGIEIKLKKPNGLLLYRIADMDDAWVPADALGAAFTAEGLLKH